VITPPDRASGEKHNFYLPKIGTEVVVDFLNGDPSYPIVVGSVYNVRDRAPRPLPQNKDNTFYPGSAEGTDLQFMQNLGDVTITHPASVNIQVGNLLNVEATSDISLHANGSLNTLADSDYKLTVGRTIATQAGYDYSINIGRNFVTQFGNNYYLKGKSINLLGYNQYYLQTMNAQIKASSSIVLKTPNLITP